jgi:predicted transcriptional regulator
VTLLALFGISIAGKNAMPDKESAQAKKQIIVSGEEALRVADALTATTFKILQLLWDEPLDVTTISKKLGLSQSYISEKVKLLEELKLLTISYTAGKRGTRKMCLPSVKAVTLLIKDT